MTVEYSMREKISNIRMDENRDDQVGMRGCLSPFLLLRASLSWLLQNGLSLLISAVSRGRSCKECGFC